MKGGADMFLYMLTVIIIVYIALFILGRAAKWIRFCANRRFGYKGIRVVNETTGVFHRPECRRKAMALGGNRLITVDGIGMDFSLKGYRACPKCRP